VTAIRGHSGLPSADERRADLAYTEGQWGPRPGGESSTPLRRSPGCLTIILTLFGPIMVIGILSQPGGAAFLGLVLLVGGITYLGVRCSRRWARRRGQRVIRRGQVDALLAASNRPVEILRDVTSGASGGVFLGLTSVYRAWVTADPQHAVMVLGPPRSGKTSAVVVPAILTAAGAVVSTSTKIDVFHATAAYRSMWGRIWLFDPSGEEELPQGVHQLRWSPVSGGSWDDSLTMARAMVDAAQLRASGDSDYWNERAGALLASLLRAAAVSGRDVQDVLSWVLRHELDQPIAALELRGEELAVDVLEGIARTGERTAGGIFSTASSVLSAYNSASALKSCERPNFDPAAFVSSTAYERARKRSASSADPPLLWALDEVANIAPLSSLPALVSEGGGQGLQVLVCLQDLSQARARWGAAADGFLSLFGTKVVFAGIGDLQTLHALSAFVGTWDRPYTSVSTSSSRHRRWRSPVLVGGSHTHSVAQTISYQRETILSEGDIANLPPGHALMLQTRRWQLLRTEPYFSSPCWQNVLSHAPRQILGR
jgi:type IV secretion system protein VirD4